MIPAEAAAAFVEFRKERHEKECPMCSDLHHGFLAGVAHARANDPEVLALVEARDELINDAFEAVRLKLDERDELLRWLDDGLAHFLADEDQAQVMHLQGAIRKAFAKQPGGSGGF